MGRDTAADGYKEPAAGGQHSHSAFGGSMAPFLVEQNNQAPYTRTRVGQGPPAPTAQDLQQAPYLALQGQTVMTLVF